MISKIDISKLPVLRKNNDTTVALFIRISGLDNREKQNNQVKNNKSSYLTSRIAGEYSHEKKKLDKKPLLKSESLTSMPFLFLK